jgi:hypothetical protein
MAFPEDIFYGQNITGIIIRPVSGDIIKKKIRPVSVTDVPWNNVKMRMPGFRCISAKGPVYLNGTGENGFNCPSVFTGKIKKFGINLRRNVRDIVKMGSCGNNKPARQ